VIKTIRCKICGDYTTNTFMIRGWPESICKRCERNARDEANFIIESKQREKDLFRKAWGLPVKGGE